MIEIVMNEREWVEKVIREESIGKKPTVVIGRMAKYYRAQGLKRSDIREKIEGFMLKCDPTINVVRWRDTIDTMIKGAAKYPLIELDKITVTVNEMEAIKRLDGMLKQRLMFALVCLAKYGNAVRPNNGGWVNQESKDIFSLANIALTSKRQALLINDLWQAGYVGYSKIVDNVNLCVKILDDESEPAIEITDFRNLGNQFRAYTGNGGYISCGNCGILIGLDRIKSRSDYDCTVFLLYKAVSLLVVNSANRAYLRANSALAVFQHKAVIGVN